MLIKRNVCHRNMNLQLNFERAANNTLFKIIYLYHVTYSMQQAEKLNVSTAKKKEIKCIQGTARY